MNTKVEQRAAGFTLLSRLTAMMRAGLKAWRAQQAERAQIEALQALAPETLDDIGVSIVKIGKPPKSTVISHPHVIAALALSGSQPTERGEP